MTRSQEGNGPQNPRVIAAVLAIHRPVDIWTVGTS